MMMKKTGARLLIWLVFAIALTAPGSLHPMTRLIGDPGIDVWNHAWGYWFVAESLFNGTLPFETPLVGGPDGGVLYFIDTPGAVAMLPITALFGPAMGYNVALILRIAMAGLAAQLLAEELSGKGLHGWVAGAAYATTPFLLCELANGISEVCATQWLALTLWAAARAFRLGTWRAWLLLGLLQGITSVSTFYYGLTSGLLVGIAFLAVLAHRVRKAPRPDLALAGKATAAAALGLSLILPHWMIFKASLQRADALIRREESLNIQLMAHNAVDPRVYFMPGDFQSVDLAALYGEPFVHTAYLRWTVLLLGVAAVATQKRLRPWAALAGASLLFGLGNYIWWDGEWLKIGGNVLSLPFEWIRQVMPQVAITHPLRLSLGAQALAAALAGAGAAVALTYAPKKWHVPLTVAICALIAAESAFGSAARWPVPTSSATVPEWYRAPEGKMVLDLPAEVGTTMLTSVYFWYQTGHGRPIPYTPDVRMGSARDTTTFRAFASHSGQPGSPTKELPRPISRDVAKHIRDTYGLVVVHKDFEQRAELSASYLDAFSGALGPPEDVGDAWVWRLE